MNGRRISLPVAPASFSRMVFGLMALANLSRVTGSMMYVKKD